MPRKMPEPRFRVGRARTGLGLFATAPIEKGDFIVEYVGPKIPNAEVEKRTGARYLFEVNSRWTVDGSPRWNVARYINHSCRPNAEPIISRGRIKIMATKRIKTGDEIAYNYGKSYFDTFIRPHGCKCPKCSPA